MINQLEVRHFDYFLALADTLHYGRASERLSISQSALSQQIQRLEFILGHQLFKRTNRKVELNEAGYLFKKEAEAVMGQWRDSLARWKLAMEEGEEQVKIGFVGSAMQGFLASKIKAFTALYPKIKFVLDELSNKEQLERLQRKQLDVGFMRSNEVADSMHFKSVYKENLCLVLPQQHALNTDNFTDMGQLAKESFILFPNQHSQMYYQQIIGLCASSGFVPKVSHRSIHGPTIFKLVEAGLGISIVPKSLTTNHSYDITLIELKDVPFQTELFAVWNKNNNNSAFESFLKLL